MNLQDWLIQQQRLYPNQNLPTSSATGSFHPVSGKWQENSPHLKSQFWWGGGASCEACDQIEASEFENLSEIGVITFGPVQTFLGGGQKLRDWAVASWLCHYLSAVLIYRWEVAGGKVLLPLHQDLPLVKWLWGETLTQSEEIGFWQAELPNVITGLYPNANNWLSEREEDFQEDWQASIAALEKAVIEVEKKEIERDRQKNQNSKFTRMLDGQGWQVIRSDCQYVWSIYADETSVNIETISSDIAKIHQKKEAQKISRKWEKPWWGGRTSPSDGCLSIWHPGLRPIHDKQQSGIWGIPKEQTDDWWTKVAEQSVFQDLFSKSDRLNSIELVKRLASVPDIIERTLEILWGRKPPKCPWKTFPDRTAAAAAWVTTELEDKPNLQTYLRNRWNKELANLEDMFPSNRRKSKWGMPLADRKGFHHPRILERRNVEDDSKDKEVLEIWDMYVPKGWESTIEWTVGWRGDGDEMGKWLSGEQYRNLSLPWAGWHLTSEKIAQFNLPINPTIDPPNRSRQIDLPHMLDLSLLFGLWNKLLYRLTEECHHGKVIFAGGDDFLLLGPITEAVSLTTDLHRLWRGETSPLTSSLDPPIDGWVQYDSKFYPVPGKQMSFSLGVVIAQRRIPQSLWHRGLNYAYKEAKNKGRDRVCVKVLFNSGQTLEWICPWRLWHRLMSVETNITERTELNCWEKLLFYLESTNLKKAVLSEVGNLLETLWQSVGISLQWQEVMIWRKDYEDEIKNWQWWIDWISLRAFLARQERERQQWIEKLTKELSQDGIQ